MAAKFHQAKNLDWKKNLKGSSVTIGTRTTITDLILDPPFLLVFLNVMVPITFPNDKLKLFSDWLQYSTWKPLLIAQFNKVTLSFLSINVWSEWSTPNPRETTPHLLSILMLSAFGHSFQKTCRCYFFSKQVHLLIGKMLKFKNEWVVWPATYWQIKGKNTHSFPIKPVFSFFKLNALEWKDFLLWLRLD